MHSQSPHVGCRNPINGANASCLLFTGRKQEPKARFRNGTQATPVQDVGILTTRPNALLLLRIFLNAYRPPKHPKKPQPLNTSSCVNLKAEIGVFQIACMWSFSFKIHSWIEYIKKINHSYRNLSYHEPSHLQFTSHFSVSINSLVKDIKI